MSEITISSKIPDLEEMREQIADLQSRVRDLEEGKPAEAIKVRYASPCFGAKELTRCSHDKPYCFEGPWLGCDFGGKSPHLAEYRGEAKPALHMVGCNICGGERWTDDLKDWVPHTPTCPRYMEHVRNPTPPPSPAPEPGTCGGCPLYDSCGEIYDANTNGADGECPARTRWREAEARAEKAEVEVTRLTGSLIEAEANAKQWRDAAMEGCTDANALASKWQAVALGERERISKKLMGNANPHVQAVAETVRSLPPPEVKS